MSDFRREGDILIGSPHIPGEASRREVRFNIFELAAIRLRTESRVFYAQYGFNWPFELGYPRALLDEKRESEARSKGVPTIGELHTSIAKQRSVLAQMESLLHAVQGLGVELAATEGIDPAEVYRVEAEAAALMERFSLSGVAEAAKWEAPDIRSDHTMRKRFELGLPREPYEKLAFHARALRDSIAEFEALVERTLIRKADAQNRVAQPLRSQAVLATGSIADELKKLGDLVNNGSMSEEEFREQKAKLLAG
jgi:Short C-terminal domain